MARPVEMLRALGWLPQPGYGRKTRHTPMRSELVVMIGAILLKPAGCRFWNLLFPFEWILFECLDLVNPVRKALNLQLHKRALALLVPFTFMRMVRCIIAWQFGR